MDTKLATKQIRIQQWSEIIHDRKDLNMHGIRDIIRLVLGVLLTLKRSCLLMECQGQRLQKLLVGKQYLLMNLSEFMK